MKDLSDLTSLQLQQLQEAMDDDNLAGVIELADEFREVPKMVHFKALSDSFSERGDALKSLYYQDFDTTHGESK